MEENLRYLVFIKRSGRKYLVFVPDFQIYTEGDTWSGAAAMAKDAITQALKTAVDEGYEAPKPSTEAEARQTARNDADEIFDYSDGDMVAISVYAE